MSKSTFFTGQPIFTQLLGLLDRNAVRSLARAGRYDRYYKHFDTYTHLVTMLYCVFNKCTSSREVVSGMKACYHKLAHTGISKTPGRSTLCDANMRRSFAAFEQIYQHLYKRHRTLLPDSRMKSPELFIADSSTITLFQEILKAPSMGRKNGKRKGGIKVHTLMNASEDVPVQISFTAARDNDVTFLRDIHLAAGSFLVFDKGYVSYAQYERMSHSGVFFVTRNKKDAHYVTTGLNPLDSKDTSYGVLSDSDITLGTRTQQHKIKLKARLVTFFDQQKGRLFEFLTNNFSLPARQIAELYKKRWQIEVLFKRIKQNFPLKYFLGDNENAIKIQIWCAFIADLLLKVVQVQLKKKWSFSNLSSIIRLHLMSYLHLFNFLNAPDKLPAGASNHNRKLKLGGLAFGFQT
ncbi:IS4 family transposase [Mucilaginibacter sp.]